MTREERKNMSRGEEARSSIKNVEETCCIGEREASGRLCSFNSSVGAGSRWDLTWPLQL